MGESDSCKLMTGCFEYWYLRDVRDYDYASLLVQRAPLNGLIIIIVSCVNFEIRQLASTIIY